MIFISSLMLMWSEFWRRFRHQIAVWSTPIGAPPPDADDSEAEAKMVIYTIWLKSLADQMLVCIFVFLTVWLIAKTPLIDIFPMVIKPSENMHVPHNGAEYRHLALDICTIFFFAIVFYFGLMFAVATAIRETTSKLEVLETSTPRDAARRINVASSPVDAARRATAAASAEAMGDIASPETWRNLQKHFVVNVGEMMRRGDPQLEEVSRLVNDDFKLFPLAKYLKFKLRVQGADLFKFSWTMWLPTIGLFIVLWALHRYAHMGYVRIMGFAGCVVLVLIICMALLTKNLIKQSVASPGGKPNAINEEKSIHERLPTEAIVLTGLEFSLFFVCYGVARMICQPWMWELHFWPVLILTNVAVLASIAFYLFIAPGIPSFIAVMAMPPFLSPDDIVTMKSVALEQQKHSEAN